METDGHDAAVAVVESCCEGFRKAVHAAGPDKEEFVKAFNAEAPGGEADPGIMAGATAFWAGIGAQVGPIMESAGQQAAVDYVNKVCDGFKAACHSAGPDEGAFKASLAKSLKVPAKPSLQVAVPAGTIDLYKAIGAFVQPIMETDGHDAAVAVVESCCEGFRKAVHAAGPDKEEFVKAFNAEAPGGEADPGIMAGATAFWAGIGAQVGPIMESAGQQAAVDYVNKVCDGFKAACHSAGPDEDAFKASLAKSLGAE